MEGQISHLCGDLLNAILQGDEQSFHGVCLPLQLRRGHFKRPSVPVWSAPLLHLWQVFGARSLKAGLHGFRGICKINVFAYSSLFWSQRWLILKSSWQLLLFLLNLLLWTLEPLHSWNLDNLDLICRTFLGSKCCWATAPFFLLNVRKTTLILYLYCHN